MSDLDPIYEAIRKADAAGDAESVKKLGAYLQTKTASAGPTEPAQKPQGWKTLQQMGKPNPQPTDTSVSLADRAKGIGTDIGHALRSEATGVMDPIFGIGQTVAHVLGHGEEADEAIKQRERDIQAERGDKGIDAFRLAGNVMAPTNYLAPGGGSNALRRIGSAVAKGAATNAEQPVTGGDFWTQKAKQAGVGGAVGAVLAPAAEVVGKFMVAPAVQAVKHGVDAFKRFLSQEMPTSLQSTAVNKVLEAFGRDEAAGGPKLTEVMDVLDTAHKAGKPLTLADVGKSEVKAMAGYVTRQPGEAGAIMNRSLDQQGAGARGRLHDDITKYVSGGDSMRQTAKALEDTRSAAAKPLWDKAMSNPVPFTPRLQQFIDDPIIQAGISRGMKTQRLTALRDGAKFDPNDYAVKTIDAFGQPVTTKVPNMKLMQAAKEGLDDILNKYRNQITGELELDKYGVAVDGVRREFLTELKRVNPDYEAALNSWSGKSQSMDALAMGHDFLKKHPEEIRSIVQSASANDREFMRLGLADKLREKIDSTRFSGDPTKALINSQRATDQIKAAFEKPEDAQKFIDNVMHERTMFDTNVDIRGNSATARRLSGDQAMEADMAAAGHAASAGAKIAGGHLLGGIADMVKMRNALGWRRNQALNAEIARLLTDPNVSQNSLSQQAGAKLLSSFPGPATRNYLTQGFTDSIQKAVPAAALMANPTTNQGNQ